MWSEDNLIVKESHEVSAQLTCEVNCYVWSYADTSEENPHNTQQIKGINHKRDRCILEEE